MDTGVPVYYVVNRHLSKNLAAPILRALNITPVYCAVIFDILDADLALHMVNEVIRTDTEEDCVTLALHIGKETGNPVLILGTADVLDAFYSDGRKETVGASC